MVYYIYPVPIGLQDIPDEMYLANKQSIQRLQYQRRLPIAIVQGQHLRKFLRAITVGGIFVL